MKLGTKLLVAFLCVGVIPFTVIGVISMDKSSCAISEQVFGQLKSVREIKKTQIENFFVERKGDMGGLVETVGTLRKAAFEKLNAVMRIKKIQIQDFFKNSFAQMAIFARSADVSMLYEELDQYHMIIGATATEAYNVGTDTYDTLYKQFSVNINQFQKDNGYHDILIICAECLPEGWLHAIARAVRN